MVAVNLGPEFTLFADLGLESSTLERSISALPGGGFVAVWIEDSATAPGGLEVAGAVYNADGSLLANFAPSELSGYWVNHGPGPTVAALPNGQFLLVWTSYNSTTGVDGTYGEVFTADGTAASPPFLAVAVAGSLDRSAAALTNGNFLVLAYDAIAGGFYGGVFGPTGSLISSVSISSSNYSQLFPHAIALPGGAFAVDWIQSNNSASSWDVYAQFYSSDGVPSPGGPVEIGSGTMNLAGEATLTDGKVVFAWADFGSGRTVNARVVNPDGTPYTAAFQVSVDASDDGPTSPVVAALSNGQFVIVWINRDETSNSTVSTVRGQLFSESGSAIGSAFVIDASLQNYDTYPNVSALSDGRILVDWTTMEPDGSSSIQARIFSVSGAANGPSIQTAAQLFRTYGETAFLADLANAAYALGPQETAEDGFNNATNPSQQADYALLGSSLHWLTATDLPTLALIANTNPTPGYAGAYLDTGISNGVYVDQNAAALVGVSSDALFLSFRGTNDAPNLAVDLGKYLAARQLGLPLPTLTPDEQAELNMPGYFLQLMPLINALFIGADSYLATHSEIAHVYVTGHSLGAAVVQEFMSLVDSDVALQSGLSASQFNAVTFASPGFGFGALPAEPNPRTLNIINEYDPVRLAVENLGPLLGYNYSDVGNEYHVRFPNIPENVYETDYLPDPTKVGHFHDASLYVALANTISGIASNASLRWLDSTPGQTIIDVYLDASLSDYWTTWIPSGALSGGSGDDLFLNSPGASDTITGGGGDDTFEDGRYTLQHVSLVANVDGSVTLTTPDSLATLYGFKYIELADAEVTLNASGPPFQTAIWDTAANITATLDGFNDTLVNAITITDNGAIGTTVGQLTTDSTTIGKLQNANASPYQLAVADSAQTVASALTR